eukprot:CAMPEP_0113622062 /NCGR_PEP_ID=MMETSP0017_2-20120614/11293_1 /TAXON_ID=2856 /ORGANISM="Cylindrotheca closterium" /LENGTH=428 /DNA_ID=CAMNT_0000531859 /DNA_START=60 /DNA_END=1346 /DNA_ORIENTATION=+ /assembly_acc=CAM_ASM_000147
MYDEIKNQKEKLDHPDSAIRLSSAVHRFQMPNINSQRKLSFARSFSTTGRHEKTRKLMLNADTSRKNLMEAVSAAKVSHERVVADSRRYRPLINQILVSCKVQPEMAMLDERLVFDWLSGLERSKDPFKSEAMMYDLVMCIACEGLGKAGVATESSIAGEFAAANREYAAAAGVFEFLADEYLPKWAARGSQVDDSSLPVECSVETAKGLSMLFKANGQQMAVATVLIKPGTPNYSLLAKLCLGIADQLEAFVTWMRDNAFKQMTRLEKDFFTLVTFQIQLQKSLSCYFHARSLWEEKQEYGLAIASLSEATVSIRTRASEAAIGVPDVLKIPSLRSLKKDLDDLRAHMALLLETWEKDNSAVYFEAVPRSVPEDKRLQAGISIGKAEKYHVKDPDPVLLSLAEEMLQRSDSDLARELQEKLNAGLES